MSKDVDVIKKLYSSLGYNFVTVNTKIRDIDKSNLDLIFEISTGEVSKISKQISVKLEGMLL